MIFYLYLNFYCKAVLWSFLVVPGVYIVGQFVWVYKINIKFLEILVALSNFWIDTSAFE